MAPLLTYESLTAFLDAHYDGGPFQVETTFATNGQRMAFQIQGARARTVVKLTDPGRRESTVATDTRTQAYLANMGFPAPRIAAARNGALYVPADALGAGRFLYCYDFIPGAAPHPGDSFYRRLGQVLAQLHTLPWEGLVPISTYTPSAELPLVREMVAAAGEPGQESVTADLLGLIDRFPSFDDLPTGIIHTDPYFVNLLETPGGALYLIDWDDAGVSYPLLDVGYVLAHLCSFTARDRALWGVPGDPEGLLVRPDWAQTFLDAYQSVRPLTAPERQRLPDAVRLAFLVYSVDWGSHRLILDNYRRMKLVEAALGFSPG